MLAHQLPEPTTVTLCFFSTPREAIVDVELNRRMGKLLLAMETTGRSLKSMRYSGARG